GRIQRDQVRVGGRKVEVALEGVVGEEVEAADARGEPGHPPRHLRADRQNRSAGSERVGEHREGALAAAVEGGAAGGGWRVGWSAWRGARAERQLQLVERSSEVVAGLAEHVDWGGRARPGAAEHEAWRDGALPAVALQEEDCVGRLAGLRLKSPVAAKRDGGGGGPAGDHGEARVPTRLPHRPQVA